MGPYENQIHKLCKIFSMHLYLLVFWRNIKKNPRMFLINILSSSFGIVAVMAIYLFVVKEYQVDKFHSKYRDIYRVTINRSNAPTIMSKTCFPMGSLLRDNHSEIVDFTQYMAHSKYTVLVDNSKFTEQKLSFVDRSFFKMFDFTLEVGHYKQLFEQPNSVFITRETARRYFQSTDVLGKKFEAEVPGRGEKVMYTVVGILSSYPEESTLRPQIMTDIKGWAEKLKDQYFRSAAQLFLHIPNCTNVTDIAKKLAGTFYAKQNEYRSTKADIDVDLLNLQKLSDLYLHSGNVEDQEFPKGDPVLLWILICVGSVLLVITFTNSIILNLGVNIKNQKQNQIHKILGGSTTWIRKKYLMESIIFTTIAFLISLLLLPATHILATRFSDYSYSLFSRSDTKILGTFFLILVVIGLISGFIHHLAISNKEKGETLLNRSGRGYVLFKRLVQFQLLVFIVATTCIFLIARQIKFISTQDLGFDVENTITVGLNDRNDKILFIQEFENKPIVNRISVGHTLFRSSPFLDEIMVEDSQSKINTQCIWGDHNYVDVYKIKMLSGRDINGDKLPPIDDYFSFLNGNEIREILVNQEFVRKSELKSPLGALVALDGRRKGEIVGIIEDVKNLPLLNSITPMAIGYGFNSGPSLVVSVKRGKMSEFKTSVDEFIKRINKDNYFGYGTYSFDFDKWYKKEQTLLQLLFIFSVITLFLLILGLIGISLFLTERRTKEIGIRKVNGAHIYEILVMLNKSFVQWVVIAFIIACPIAYFTMSKWLESFAYKTTLSWWIFALAGALALGIALVTVSWQSWRAATRNPIESLRYE